ncbi:glycerophosphoryl diester phosphodiesterase [Fontibacillus panacisegetis]|uniref:Glycerophosphoryl diester phosphodiesterase n=1 Tax=Fontibacillus panacisegetis TaxID=670482 RepID=A0A1G7MRS4_9BACL|nr:glycerophosphodiester phosphodiesterase family protein [Fontibacillus panacisegetis]SDF64483.1 glycerophosphoryl diester phosphodiesterase [Fontibacillus panacisegetis]
MHNYCVAHRGYSGKAPENTMSAINLAMQEPYVKWVEVDIQLSKDGIPFLIHDYTLNRTTNGRGPVKDKTWDELSQLDAGRWYSKSFIGERLVRLDDFLDKIKGRLRANIEIKTQGNLYPNIEEKVISAVKQHRMEHEVVLTSFEPRVLAKVKEISCKIRTGLIIDSKPKDLLLRLQMLKCSFLSINYRHLNSELAEKAIRRGIEVMAWTVDDVRRIKRVAAIHPEILICTNRPDLWYKAIGQTE